MVLANHRRTDSTTERLSPGPFADYTPHSDTKGRLRNVKR